MKIHHAIIKSLAALDLAIVPMEQDGFVSIQMDAIEIVAGRVEDIKELSAKAKSIVSDEDFDLDALREEGEEADDVEEVEEQEEEERGSVVKDHYRAIYREIDAHDSNGDQIALAMRAAVTQSNFIQAKTEGKGRTVETMSMETLLDIAAQNGLGTPGGKNPGQRRMNLGNMLRGRLNRGIAVHIGTNTVEPNEEQKARGAVLAAKQAARLARASAPRLSKEEAAVDRNAKAKARRAVRTAQKQDAAKDDTHQAASA